MVVRFSLELIVGVALAAIVTAAVMVTMFYFGPWADPPGMDELWWLLTTAAVMLASCRWGHADEFSDLRSSIVAAVPDVSQPARNPVCGR